MNRTGGLLLALAPGVGFLLLLFGLPLVRVVAGSFTAEGPDGLAFSLAQWIELLTNPVYLDGLAFSLWLGVAPTLLSFVISLPLAALMQANRSSRRLFGTLYRIPLVVPGIVAAFLVLVILDRGGMLSRLLMPFGIAPPRLVRDAWGIGAIIASCWKNVPFMTLIISGALASINRDLLSAAQLLGAGRLTILLRVQLPLAQAGITAAILLTFIGSMGSFVIPNLLGPAYPLPLSVQMYALGFREGNWPLVYAMGTLLSLVAIAVLLAYYTVVGSFSRASARAGS